MAEEAAVEMFVGGLLLDPHTQAPVVVLKNESGTVHLPIWIGIAEATSIASAIRQLAMARPLTHDLMHQVFGELGVRLERIVITDLKESTYYAEIILLQGEKAIILDARPSDAIALALRSTAPIFVAQVVLDRAKIAFNAQSGQSAAEQGEKEGVAGDNNNQAADAQAPGPDFKNIDKDKWSEILSQLDPEDFKYKM